jgi:methyl-accepting chemotaxis protein
MILLATREIAQLSLEVNKSISRVNQLLESDDFEGIVSNLNSISAKLTEVNMKDLVSELVVTLNKTSTAIGNIDRMILRNRANINETMESLREATANLNEFSRQIAEQPSIIIRGN